VGAEAHAVAVPPSDDPHPVRRFGAYMVDLEALADWLAACGITTVALESTGVYWRPLFERLEPRAFEVLLVDPQQV
jgi:transposase